MIADPLLTLFDGERWLADVVWQSTLSLGLGALGAMVLRRRPAHAHAWIWLSLGAALLTPLVSALARAAGLGLFAPLPVGAPRAGALPAGWEDGAGALRGGGAWLLAAQVIWGAAALRLLVRWGQSARAGRRLLETALPFPDAEVNQLARREAAHLGIAVPPRLYLSRAVSCPHIWCWGRTPRILLPWHVGAAPPGGGLAGLLCHELAHFRRRDHLGAALAELAVCLLPWHPLAWWLRRRLAVLSEQAADRWVIARGEPRARFAEALLRSVPQARRTAALAAVSRRSDLKARIDSILSGPAQSPRTDRGWRFLSLALSISAVVGLALAQRRAVAALPGDGPPPAALQGGLVPREGALLLAYPAMLDLGVVAAGTTGQRDLWLINPSNQPVTLTEVKAGCGCTTIVGFEPVTLAPGGWTRLRVVMEAAASAGERRDRLVFVHVEGQATLRVPVAITTS